MPATENLNRVFLGVKHIENFLTRSSAAGDTIPGNNDARSRKAGVAALYTARTCALAVGLVPLVLWAQSETFKRSYASGTTTKDVCLVAHENDSYKLAVSDLGTSAKDTATFLGFSRAVLETVLKKQWTELGADATTLTLIVDDLERFDTRPSVKLSGVGLSNYTTSTKGVSGAGAAAGFGLSVNWKDGRRINVIGTVTQTQDTIESTETADFAQTVLVPGIRRFSIMAVYREMYALKRNADGSGWGWGTYVNATPMNWKTFRYSSVGSDVRDSVSVVRQVTPITWELYLSRTLLFMKSWRNPCRITVDMGAAAKYLGDNAMSADDHKLFLGTTQDLFVGPLIGLDLRFADSHAYFYGTWMVQNAQGGVPGLTGPQLQAGISLSATIANLSD